MKLDSLAKTYPDGTVAVNGIDLILEDGRFIVLLGPSGCGKTTTLRMIAGLETPTAGRIEFAGRDITHLGATERDVGFVFQFYALYPHMTIRENVCFPLANAGIPPMERYRRVEETADRLGIQSFLDRHPNELSDGDQQRVSLARAIVRDPSIYLMDEPLGQLDANIRLDLRGAIRSQQLATQVTTVYVTHDQEEALSLADTVVVMNEGEIEQVGTPDEVYNNPKNLFVANFVGSPCMNFIEGVIEHRDGKTVFCRNGHSFDVPDGQPSASVTLGIRPEYIRFDEKGGVRGEITVSEYFGDHHIVHVETELGGLSIRTSDSATPGDRVKLSLDTDRIRLFSSSE